MITYISYIPFFTIQISAALKALHILNLTGGSELISCFKNGLVYDTQSQSSVIMSKF